MHVPSSRKSEYAQVYHSKFNGEAGLKEACKCALLPIKTTVKGPAVQCPPGACSENGIVSQMEAVSLASVISPLADQEDVIDEAIFLFRANLFFKKFDIEVRDRPCPHPAPSPSHTHTHTHPSRRHPTHTATASMHARACTHSGRRCLTLCRPCDGVAQSRPRMASVRSSRFRLSG
jgi:hypothetical protein